jgi:hypothetical protein
MSWRSTMRAVFSVAICAPIQATGPRSARASNRDNFSAVKREYFLVYPLDFVRFNYSAVENARFIGAALLCHCVRSRDRASHHREAQVPPPTEVGHISLRKQQFAGALPLGARELRIAAQAGPPTLQPNRDMAYHYTVNLKSGFDGGARWLLSRNG